MPARLDVTAARNVPWRPTLNLFYLGGPLPELASVALHVRQYPGMPGSPNASATVTWEDSEALSGSPASRVLKLYPTIAEALLDAMPSGLNQPEAGEADRFAWDAVGTYADGFQERLAEGYFYLKPGVTE